MVLLREGKIMIATGNAKDLEIVVEKFSESQDYEEFVADLPETECRWAVYDVQYEKEGKRNKIMFVSW